MRVLAAVGDGQGPLGSVPRAAVNCSVEQLPVVELDVKEPEAVLVLLDFAYDLGATAKIWQK